MKKVLLLIGIMAAMIMTSCSGKNEFDMHTYMDAAKDLNYGQSPAGGGD